MISQIIIVFASIYYTFVLLLIAMEEYENRSSMLIDLIIPFSGIFRLIIWRYKGLE